MVLIILFAFNPDNILKFAGDLELQGDYFRSISEYKRYLHHNPEVDSIRYRIASIYSKNEMYCNAIDVLRDVREKDKQYRYRTGELFYRAGYYDSCKNYWNGKLNGLIYLREGNIKRGMDILNLQEKPGFKNPLLAATLSTILPGSGRIYADRWGDGIFSMLLISTFTYYSYKYYREENYLNSGLFGAVAMGFYCGNIYGSYISVKVYNTSVLDEYINKIEKCLLH